MKFGQKVKVDLLSTRTDTDARRARGVSDKNWIGTACCDLVVGKRFSLDTGDCFIHTSIVEKIQNSTFTTENSTYSFQVIDF